MPDPIKAYQCRHIFADGHRCGSKSLRGESFCFYHHATRRPLPKPVAQNPHEATFELPFPEDLPSLRLAIAEVLRRIAANAIDSKRAGLLLYGLQIAAQTLPRPRLEEQDEEQPTVVEEVETHPAHGPVAPIAEYTEPVVPLSYAGQLLKDLEALQALETTPEPARIATIQAVAAPHPLLHSRKGLARNQAGRSPDLPSLSPDLSPFFDVLSDFCRGVVPRTPPDSVN